MLSTGLDELDKLLKGGYPDKSAILVVGPPGIGKEALGYWFIQNGLNREDFCLYVTRLAVSEVLQDIRAFGINGQSTPVWFARDGGQTKVELRLYEEGVKALPLLRIRKMRGMPPEPEYYNFSFSHRKMEIKAYVR